MAEWWESYPVANKNVAAPTSAPAEDWWSAYPVAEAPKERSTLENIGRQAGLTGRYLLEGPSEGIGGLADVIVRGAQEMPLAVAGRKLSQALGLPTERYRPNAGQVGEAVANAIGLPSPETDQEKIVAVASKAAIGGGVGAALAGKAAATGSQIAKTMAAAPGTQMASAAAGGAASEGVRQGGGGAGEQMAASLAASLIPGAMSSAAREAKRLAQLGKTPIPQEAAEVIAEGLKRNVPVTTSDLMPPKTFAGKNAQSAGATMPIIGRGKQLAEQQASREMAIQDFAKEVGADVPDLESKIVQNVFKNRGLNIAQSSAIKENISTELASAGGVPMPKAVEEIKGMIKELKKLEQDGAVPEAIKFLEGRVRAFGSGKDFPTTNKELKIVGAKIKDQSMSTIKGLLDDLAKPVYAAAKEDMGEFIKRKGRPGQYDEWTGANKDLSDSIDELQSATLKSMLKTGDIVPEKVRPLLMSKRPSEQKLLYSQLDEEGRGHTRAFHVSEAIKAAEKGGPNAFATYMRNHKDQIDVFFRGSDKQKLKAFERLISKTRYAQEAPVFTATGVQNKLPVLGAALVGMFGSVGAGAAVAATIGGMARVYESPKMRDALLRLAATKKNSPGESAAIGRIAALLQAEEPQEEKK